ncbi:MAG: DUF1338 family protein [Alphaproteobacteria bacterium]|nr:DUF1338 family protein [Alphaproteobacteria bacterium]
MSDRTILAQLLTGTASGLVARVALPATILAEGSGPVSRATLAAALNLELLAGLLARVPSGRAYVDDLARAGRRLVFDHGAMRTVAMEGMGTLPAGLSAIARILEPLGYHATHVYPMPRLKMTGRAFTHYDLPEDLPQFFVSELHPEHFSPDFQAAVRRVTEESADPLTAVDLVRLARLNGDGALPLEEARALLPQLATCFTRRHEAPRLGDYEILKAESAEMAWIATEGNAFNHATDRVADLEAVVTQQIALGRRVKERIEVSASGRVRQTALHADPVMREFLGTDGARVQHEVPGSFFEFITREPMPGEDRLDLAFDTNNAQGIFKMTAA